MEKLQPMKIIIANSSQDPIYEQIARQIKTQIISGELAEGRRCLDQGARSGPRNQRHHDKARLRGTGARRLHRHGRRQGTFVASQNPSS